MPDGVCKSPSNDNMIKKIKVIPVWFLLYRLGMLLDWPCPFWRTFWCLSQHHDMKWKGCTWLWNRHQCLMHPSILKRPVSKACFPDRQLMSVARSRWSCFFPLYLQEILFHIHVFMSFGQHCPVMAAWSRLGFLQLAVRWAQVTISCGKFNGVITYALGQINPTCKNADISWNDISLYQALFVLRKYLLNAPAR